MKVPVIRTERLVLRPVAIDDVPLIAKWKSDPLVKAMALDPTTVIDIKGQQADVERAISSDDETYQIICLTEREQPIGYIRTNFMDEEKKIAWLRFALGAQRGKGYMKEGLAAFIGHLFNTGIDRIEAEVYDTNHPSKRLMESLGFVAEGRKREAHFDGNKYIDVIVYGLLGKEWTGNLNHSSMKLQET